MKPEKQFNQLRILIVDDQADARSMLRAMLSEFGITQIYDASNGREALSFIDVAPDMVDLVICDWNMPRMTGMELLRQLRSVYPDTPFLMVTGRKDIDSIAEAKSAGVSAYIGKPFSPAQLEVKLRVILQQSKRQAS
jgi:two-component system, chemotaxis family, chemotaxis protein CheY